MVRVSLDAMGGDNAPMETVKGAVLAAKACEELKIFAVGTKEAGELLAGMEYPKDRIEFIQADEVISMSDHPNVVTKKRDSSLVKGLMLVKKQEADAFVSAGNTGAVLFGAQAYIGSVDGVRRARSPLAMLIPTLKGVSLLLDCGANVDARPSDLVRFAKLGSIYYENMVGKKEPKVAIVNIGTEETKGNSLVLETFPLLRECKDINFAGSIESRNIPAGEADVIVCDAFVGNVILKLYEGVAMSMMSMIKETFMSSLKTKIGALLVKNELKDRLKVLSAKEHGGAPLLGLESLVVKTHGNSEATEIKNSILQCVDFVKSDVTGKMKDILLER